MEKIEWDGKYLQFPESPPKRYPKNLHQQNVRKGFIPLIEAGRCQSFEELIDEEIRYIKSHGVEGLQFPDLIRRGFYATQLRRWFEHFDRKQILHPSPPSK